MLVQVNKHMFLFRENHKHMSVRNLSGQCLCAVGFVIFGWHSSGRHLSSNMLYGRSDFNRLDFSGFYTFILERGDEVISVATVR